MIRSLRKKYGFRSLLEFAAKSRNCIVSCFFVGTSYGGADGGAQAPLVFAPRVPQSSNPSALPPDLEVGRQSFNGTLENTMTNSLVFESTTFDVTDMNGQQWLRSPQIGGALGYAKRADSIDKLYKKHAAEFTDSMTALVKLPTAGGEQETRIFSLRGAHLLAMFARTAIAALFRKWVLDILDGQLSSIPLQLPNVTITPAQAQHLRELVQLVVESGKQGHGETWNRLHRKMKTNSYLMLRPDRFYEAANYLRGKIDDQSMATLIQKHLPHAVPSITTRNALQSLPAKQFSQTLQLMRVMTENGVSTVDMLPIDAIPELVMHEKELFNADLTLKIATRANLRMMGEVARMTRNHEFEARRKDFTSLPPDQLNILLHDGFMEMGLRTAITNELAMA